MIKPVRPNLAAQRALILAALAATLGTAHADPLHQWAGSVLGYSSQYSKDDWSAAQALGAPDTASYGDQSTAWSPATPGDGPEFISVGYAQPVYAEGALVREVFGNGFVVQIDAIDTLGAVHTVWTGDDTSPQDVAVDFMAHWAATSFLTRGLTVHIDTTRFGSFEEIDAIALLGSTTQPVPEPGSWALLAAGLGLVLRRAHRHAAAA